MDNLEFETSYEPMDIDMSAHSNNEMDISYNISNNEINTVVDTTRIKTEPIDEATSNSMHHPSNLNDKVTPNAMQHPSDVKKFSINMHSGSNTRNRTIFNIISAVFIIFISIIAYQVLNIKCSNNLNPDELKSCLSSKLYGQSQVIYSFIQALNVGEKNKVLFFYGGTGVGKTYMASLIMEQTGYYSNVYHYTMPSFKDTFTTDFMIGFTVCRQTIVIVDDLNANDMYVKAHIKDLITKSKDFNKNVTVILIFNCDNSAKDFDRQCDESFSNQLLNNFKDIDAFKILIKFEALKEEHLRKCIENELGNRKLDDKDFEKISKNFNVSLDGCKGVYTKMKVLEIS